MPSDTVFNFQAAVTYRCLDISPAFTSGKRRRLARGRLGRWDDTGAVMEQLGSLAEGGKLRHRGFEFALEDRLVAYR